MHAAVFLDRDGTLIEEKEFLRDVDQVHLLPGVSRALRQLQDAGFKLFIVSNQSGVGRGYFTLGDVEEVNRHLLGVLSEEGIQFSKVYFAPEAPNEPSRGRKPSPQFLFDARDEFSIDLGRSYMIGDKWSDLECGWNAGVKKSLLVRTGYGARVAEEAKLTNAAVVDDLRAAAVWILSQSV